MMDRYGHRSAGAAKAVPLSHAEVGQQAVLTSVNGGRGMLLRLAEMGIRPGIRFEVLSKGRPGPFIILANGMRLVLGQGMVQRIFVRIV